MRKLTWLLPVIGMAVAGCNPAALLAGALEPQAKAAFQQGCVKTPELQAYCDCSWSELLKRVKLEEFMDSAFTGSDKYKKSVQEAAEACKSKLPG